MPGRTMTRFAAVLAVAAAAGSPGFAREPVPPTAPPPRPAKTECPAPRPIAIDFSFPTCRAVRGGGQELRLVEIVCGPQAERCCAAECKPAAGPLCGTWFR